MWTIVLQLKKKWLLNLILLIINHQQIWIENNLLCPQGSHLDTNNQDYLFYFWVQSGQIDSTSYQYSMSQIPCCDKELVESLNKCSYEVAVTEKCPLLMAFCSLFLCFTYLGGNCRVSKFCMGLYLKKNEIWVDIFWGGPLAHWGCLKKNEKCLEWPEIEYILIRNFVIFSDYYPL
jgi:hypothetical protein